MEWSAEMADGTETMIISFQGEIAKIEIPKEENQQMVSIVISEEATDIYLNGIPIDPDTGERVNPEEKMPDAMTKAADAFVEAFKNGEWKIGSDSFKRVSAAVEAYEQAKTLSSISEITPEVDGLPMKDDVHEDQPSGTTAV